MPITDPAALGLLAEEWLNGFEWTGNAVSSGVLTIEPRKILRCAVNIGGYSGGDIASLRFNGDSGSNYWDRHITWAAGGTTAVNTQNISTQLVRLAGNAVTQGRVVQVVIMNVASITKPVGISHLQTLTGSAATAGVLDIGGGEWVNTSAQITSIEMRTAGGSITMPAGTRIDIYGSPT
jgi:hypothetical protein